MCQDVLIAFMPFMRDEHPVAIAIYSRFQSSNDQAVFTSEARGFLRRQKDTLVVITSQFDSLRAHDDPIMESKNLRSPNTTSSNHKRSPVIAPPARNKSISPVPISFSYPQGIMMPQSNNLGDPPPGLPPGVLNATTATTADVATSATMPSEMMNVSFHRIEAPSTIMHPVHSISPATLTRVNLLQERSTPPPPSLSMLLQQSPQSSSFLQSPILHQQPLPTMTSTPTPPTGSWQPTIPGLTDPAEVKTEPTSPRQTEGVTPKPKPVYQPRRLWTRIDQQPGRILANDIGTKSTIPIQPRHELTAKWILPLKYLRGRAIEKNLNSESMSLRDALASLTVGLFRRGCAENGANASIISKEVLAMGTDNRSDFFFGIDKGADAVWGTIPFYAPRTPGHVLFRLFWQDEPLYTLATSPTLYVTVSENDFEPTLRFILSNFKSKKGSLTSLSSLNALASVLEQFQPSNQRQNFNKWDAAGRAAWGCVCESRKVLDACASEFLKAKDKLAKLEVEVVELKALAEEETQQGQDTFNNGFNGNGDDAKCGDISVSLALVREKTGVLHGGRSTSERKWKDAQCAFAGILKAIVYNQNTTLLFRRELLAKIRLEYELWCPLSESFARSPWNRNESFLCVDFQAFPQLVSQACIQQCVNRRQLLQKENLNFVPNRSTLKDLVMSSAQPQAMNRKVVEALNNLSGAMGQLYQDEYMVGDRVMQQREMVRSRVESIVARCDAFPAGTRVVVFGSAANGFGSPSSDLDMCLQLPQGTSITTVDDPTGASAMGKLALQFEQAGLQNVDTARLTARIPIIMSKCPRPLARGGEDLLMECDLSMQNPLACLNTSLLLTYSQIHPLTRVLAALIKRWAKARDLNSPSQGTLSSYGYIIMLLHFMTYHCRDGTGLVSTIEGTNGGEATPLLPNLQWMDIKWPTSSLGTPYKEQAALPTNLIPHPIEPDMFVNTYFYRLADQNALHTLQRRFPCQDLSLAILLASFFRYYAYEFDFKKFVVSMQANATNGMVEREVKAELNGWKVFSTGLAIEDPFEGFYDVAHVLKGYNFHRLRNEFAFAYTKIADSAGTTNARSGRDLIDWICEPLSKD
jgi:DNA polymerase sigma